MLDSKYLMTYNVPDLFQIQSTCFSNVSKINDVEPEFVNLSIIMGDG